jgi:hypothetical protein
MEYGIVLKCPTTAGKCIAEYGGDWMNKGQLGKGAYKFERFGIRFQKCSVCQQNAFCSRILPVDRDSRRCSDNMALTLPSLKRRLNQASAAADWQGGFYATLSELLTDRPRERPGC